jgi:hypothetical protein
MPAAAPLRVFLSYAHEDAKHRVRVKALAQRLQQAGMEVTLDQDWPTPVEGWVLWVEREVTAADVVLLVITRGFRDAFDGSSTSWPGPVVGPKLFESESGHRAFVPVVFSTADAVYRPGSLAHQTFYSVETEAEIELLLRLLAGFAPHPQTAPSPPGVTVAEPARPRSALPRSPLPPIEFYVGEVQARLSMHRRAWRYFSSRLEAIRIVLKESELDATGVQTLTGPGIKLKLTQHSEHCEAVIEILPGTARVYANLLGLVSGARQPIECTHLAFTLKPEWGFLEPFSELRARLADTDIKSQGVQGLVLHGWRFVVPALARQAPESDPLRILPRPPYPWPLNPLRLLLHLMEKTGALVRKE